LIVVVDIDGTVTSPCDRLKYLNQSPKDWDSFYEKCGEDAPQDDIIKMLKIMYYNDEESVDFVFCTGRRESCRVDTEEWLRINMSFAWPSPLLMRENGDKRHDTIVKPSMLSEYLFLNNKNDSDVSLIFEDRNSMVKKWRELGYRCLQVQDGDF